MINQDQSVPCPVCQTKIPIDTKQLLLGARFSCSSCEVSISLSDESKPLVQKTLNELEELKNKSSE